MGTSYVRAAEPRSRHSTGTGASDMGNPGERVPAAGVSVAQGAPREMR